VCFFSIGQDTPEEMGLVSIFHVIILTSSAFDDTSTKAKYDFAEDFAVKNHGFFSHASSSQLYNKSNYL